MDGTLLTSIRASQRVWGRWAAEFGLDAESFLPQAHGMRVVEVIEQLAIPGVDPVLEAERIFLGELDDMTDVEQIAGAGAFLSSLPRERWAVVTSAPRSLAQRRLAAAGLPVPPLLVSAEDIDRGKPDPACFLLAARTLGVVPASCLVFEDAAAGIAAGEASGASVFVVTGAHVSPVATPHAEGRDFSDLSVRLLDGGRMSLTKTM